MSENAMNAKDDWADRVGRGISAVFIVCLAAMFAYAYLGHALFGV
jgi:hypothetical protein